MGKQLTEDKKLTLQERIKQGAQNYERYLVNKSFKIVCEDGSETIVRFFKKDFKHLTGIKSDLSEAQFYEKCLEGKISTGNILTEQKYNWKTLKDKSERIQNIHKLLYEDVDKTLLLNDLETNTHVFPIAIRNDEANICVGFVSDANKARSLRKATSSQDAGHTKVITAIYGKKNGESDYSEAVYKK